MAAKTPLAEQPGMDTLRIGPAGQTFAELKQAVLDARQKFQAELLRGRADNALMERYDSAVGLLKAAYVRVGLPYKAP